jgi:DNA repair protein RadC
MMESDSEKADPPPDHLGHRARMRERLLKSDGKGLQDYEILEMLLFSATPRRDTKPLAKRLLARFGGFARVLQASSLEIARVDGMSAAGVASIRLCHVALERMLKEEASSTPIIASWTSLLDYCRVTMGHKSIEEFRVYFLNQKHRLIADELQQSGTINQAPVYAREIVKRALDLSASSLILAHNHPSGDPAPSKQDIEITRQIAAAAAMLEIEVHDHVIIAGGKHYSFRSNGLL